MLGVRFLEKPPFRLLFGQIRLEVLHRRILFCFQYLTPFSLPKFEGVSMPWPFASPAIRTRNWHSRCSLISGVITPKGYYKRSTQERTYAA